ncbi:MAG TPA: LuxR C-terminal-related transcriptional regulator [Humisphaera sp.]
MSKSARPTAQQVRAVLRLFGDARAIVGHPALQRQVLLDGACALVGADEGFFSEFDDYVPGRAPKGVSTVGSTHLDSRIARVTAEWYATHAVEMDAMGAAIYEACAVPGPQVVSWRDVAPQRPSRHYGSFYDILATVRLAEILDPFSRHPSGNMLAMSLHRYDGGRPFTARERAVALLIAEELQWLHDTRRMNVRDLVGRPLPPRLAQLLGLMLTARSTKQIAAEMGLSVHTTRDYTKDLYARLGIDSREQLMATMLPQQRGSADAAAGPNP